MTVLGVLKMDSKFWSQTGKRDEEEEWEKRGFMCRSQDQAVTEWAEY